MYCQRAFEELKVLFAWEPVLKHSNSEQLFVMQADASDVTLGAIQLQRHEKGQMQLCAYMSQNLTTTEWSWVVWEKEAFAVWWVLLMWQHLLEGAQEPFEVWTDHKNLEALQTPWTLSLKQVRWAGQVGIFSGITSPRNMSHQVRTS